MRFRRQVVILIVVYISLCKAAKKKPADLKIEVQFKPETCTELASPGDDVSVHYTGTLESGTIFDSSRAKGRDPLAFKLGEGRVIPGWEKGILGMCVGEKRKLIVPPHLAYGKKGYPPAIPGDAVLSFEIELIALEKKTDGGTDLFQASVPIVQFLCLPAIAILLVYYLYDKYKTDSAEEKRTKAMKKEKKKRR